MYKEILISECLELYINNSNKLENLKMKTTEDLYYEFINGFKDRANGNNVTTNKNWMYGSTLDAEYALGSKEDKLRTLNNWQAKMQALVDSGNEKALKWIAVGEEK